MHQFQDKWEHWIWEVKFAMGFTGLVCMYVYWPAYRQYEIPTNDVFPGTFHFAGWAMIAYAMACSPTAEGTVKKGILRLLGTLLGAFSGWLALIVCGEQNEIALTVWMTIFTAIPAYVGLPRGPLAWMGAHPDYGYSVAVFVMTQCLVIVDVVAGAGGKGEIVVNRIVGNVTGIGMAIVLLGLVPYSPQGGNPKYARAVWIGEQESILYSLRLLLQFCQERERFARQVSPTYGEEPYEESQAGLATIHVCKNMNIHRSQTLKELTVMGAEANDYYADASQFSFFPLFQTDPRLGVILQSLKIVGSCIDTSLSFAAHVLQQGLLETKNDDMRKHIGQTFLADRTSQQMLKYMVQQLEASLNDLYHDSSNDASSCGPPSVIEVDYDGQHGANYDQHHKEDDSHTINEDPAVLSQSLASKVFVYLVQRIFRRLHTLQDNLATVVQWGMLGPHHHHDQSPLEHA